MRALLALGPCLPMLFVVPLLAAESGCNRAGDQGDREIKAESAPEPKRGTDRYVLSVIRAVTGPMLVRADTSTCRLWQMRLDEKKWEAVAPETRAPGEGLPVKAGRYVVSNARSKYGSVFLCNDAANGSVYLMPMSGEGGWQPIEEPDDPLGKLDRIPLSSEYVKPAEQPGTVRQPEQPDPDVDAVIMRETIRDKAFPPEMRVFAATQLANISSEETLPALIEALDDPDPAVVVAAVRALELNGDPEAIPALKKLLSHEDQEVRAASQQVIKALAE